MWVVITIFGVLAVGLIYSIIQLFKVNSGSSSMQDRVDDNCRCQNNQDQCCCDMYACGMCDGDKIRR